MARFFIVILLASVVLLGNETAFAQTFPQAFSQFERDRGERIFNPVKKIRERAANGVLKDAKAKICEACKLNGKLCPKCACKRKERAEKEEEEKAKEEAAKEAELKKLEAEAKKAGLEAKLLQEQDIERHKPWDIADPENLESPSQLLKLAAGSKQDQDLAPKKQEALDYLAQLGCNKDPNVEKAILAGLQDYNAKVRLAAVQAVLDAVRGPMPAMVSDAFDPYQECLGQPEVPEKVNPAAPPKVEPPVEAAPDPCAKPDPCEVTKKRSLRRESRKKTCRGCRGGGCNACNYRGQITEIYSPQCGCEACSPQEVACDDCGCWEDGCRSCCPSPDIMAELKRIAFAKDPDRENCRYEPSLDVRNLALEALNVCPKISDPVVTPIVDPIIETGGEDEKKKGGISEERSGGDDSSSDLRLDPNLKNDKKEDDDNGGDPTTQSSTESPFRSVVSIDSKSRLLGARLSKFLLNGAYLVEFDGDYLIPSGKRLFVQIAGGASQIVEVLESEVGFAKVTPVEGTLFDQQDSRLSIGIVQ